MLNSPCRDRAVEVAGAGVEAGVEVAACRPDPLR